MNENIEGMTYSIQQVADITGLSKQVIRKWEERYGIVNPKRLDNGYRIYSHKEVNILLYVKSLVEKGQTVKQAALHINKEEMLPSMNSEQMLRIENQPALLNEHVLSLLYEGTFCHEENINRILQHTYYLYGLETFLESIVIPFLQEVGQRWEDGRWGEWQEALTSLVVRDFLVQLRRNFQFNENAPLMLGACLPEERHEIPLHIILLKSMLRGWRTVIVGPAPAPNAIQSTIKQLNPKKVVLSAVTTLPFEENVPLLKELDEFAAKNPHIDYYLGGPGVKNVKNQKPLQHIIVTNNIEDIFN